MTVLIVYVLLVAFFEIMICFIGIAVDSVVPSGWNLIVAMAMFFAVLAVMWPVAVYITERWLAPADSTKPDHAVRPVRAAK
jgi:hypothetical protein